MKEPKTSLSARIEFSIFFYKNLIARKIKIEIEFVDKDCSPKLYLNQIIGIC